MSQSNAPFATSGSAIGEDPHKGGRRRADGAAARQDAPFATNYPEQSDVDREETPSKHVGRRRYEAQDAAHDAPFATGAKEEFQMFQEPPPAAPPANNTPAKGDSGRQAQVKHSDNSDVFRYDGSSNDTPDSRPGRRRFQQEKHDAPFATFGGSDDRFKNSGSQKSSQDGVDGGAGVRKQERNVPPPNSYGEGVVNRSQIRDCPFALN